MGRELLVRRQLEHTREASALERDVLDARCSSSTDTVPGRVPQQA